MSSWMKKEQGHGGHRQGWEGRVPRDSLSKGQDQGRLQSEGQSTVPGETSSPVCH